MATKELKVRVKHAYLSAAEWVNKNPILQAGEFGIENDTQKFKIGDGVKKWSNLPYVSGITVDAELSSTSTNPVQNKVVTEALANVEVDTATNSEIDAALNLAEIGVLPENGVVPVRMGGTGATTIADARTNLGVSATTDFAKVAFSGSYNDLTGTPTIPTATGDLTNNSGYITSSALNGYVKSVNGTSPDSNGNVSISVSGSNYTLPTASSSTLGGVKIGSNISVSDGTISLAKSNVTSALGYTPATTNNASFTGTTMVQTLTVSSALNIPGGSIWIE